MKISMRDRITNASSMEELQALLTEAKLFAFASKRTKKRWKQAEERTRTRIAARTSLNL